MVAEADELDARFCGEMGTAAEIAAVADPVVEDLGFRLVRVVVSGRGGGTVQIMVEKADGTVTVDDCALISRRLSPVLDVQDPIAGRYNLEVSSPGIDRPLVRPRDFVTWAGFEAKVELKQPIAGRKRFRGVIEGYEHGAVRLQVPVAGAAGPEVIALPVALIATAKLVLSEELIKAALAKTP